MKRKNEFCSKKGSTFYLLMGSFMAVMLVCSILIGSIFIQNEYRVLKRTEALYGELAEKSMNAISDKTESLDTFADTLASEIEEELTTLSLMDADEISQADLSSLGITFRRYYIASAVSSGTVPYLYFKTSNYCMGLSSEENVIESGEISGMLGITDEDWETLISAVEEPTVFIQKTEQMDFARLMISKKVQPYVYLIFAVSSNEIIEEMNRQYLPEGSMLMLLTSNGQYILSETLSEDGPSLSDDDLANSEGSAAKYTYQGKTYFLYSQQAGSADIHAAVLIYDDLYPRFYRNTILAILGAILLWLLAGGAASYLIASKLYRPVSVLLKNLPIEDPTSEGGNELRSIQTYVDGLQKNNQTIAEQQQEQERLLASSLFLRLLNGTLAWSPDIAAHLANTGFPADSSRYLLSQVSVLPSPENDDAHLALSVYDRFSFHQVLEEQLALQGYDTFCVSCTDCFVLFIDLGEKEPPDLAQIHRLHPKDYSLAFMIGASAVHVSMEELSTAYAELQRVMDEMGMEDMIGSTLFYQENMVLALTDSYPGQFLSSVYQLANLIQSANFDAALEQSKKLYTLLDDDSNYAKTQPKMLAYLRNTIWISLSCLPRMDMNAVDQLFLKYALHRDESLPAYFGQLSALLKELPDLITADTKAADLMKQITAYLQENYQNSSLSAGQVADHFSLTPSWLSVHFKEEIGTGFLDYLHSCRLAKAKELLRDRSANIRDIAVECGYTNAATFSRAFTRYEGITPSQYRQNLVS